MGTDESEGGLRRRMPLRKVGKRSGVASASASAYDLGCHAMRYYRLWIYTCNTALLAGALAFSGAAIKTVVFDFRRSLVPSLTMYQPSFMYAYLAIMTQSGALQLLGCMAALRLSERLLNAYWLLLFVLTFGDIVIGAFWAYKFERICQELRPALKLRFQQEYGTNSALTTLWDRLQNEESCCGVTGPDEFSNDTGTTRWELPASCCSMVPINNTVRCTKVHSVGCDERLLAYLRSTASILAVLGYCVLTFLKVSFLGILRYEIREMIQKIRILRAEFEFPNVNGIIPSGLKAEGAESERESLLVRPESTNFLSTPMTQPKNPNGNNNYEMREYNSNRTENI